MLHWLFPTRDIRLDRGFNLDRRRREISRDGQVFVLQNKALKVLENLMNASPDIVSRSELIEEIWGGNHLTGQKGINQALWSIRSALGDEVRDPVFIETIPREGYRWIEPVVRSSKPKRKLQLSIYLPRAAILAAVLVVTGSSLSQMQIGEVNGAKSIASPDGTGRAWFEGRDIIVEYGSGGRYVMRPIGRKTFGRPTYSPDGERLAFTASLDGKCELIVVEFSTEQFQKYIPCPQQTGI